MGSSTGWEIRSLNSLRLGFCALRLVASATCERRGLSPSTSLLDGQLARRLGLASPLANGASRNTHHSLSNYTAVTNTAQKRTPTWTIGGGNQEQFLQELARCAGEMLSEGQVERGVNLVELGERALKVNLRTRML